MPTLFAKAGTIVLATLLLAVLSVGPVSAQTQLPLVGRWVLESPTRAAADIPRAVSVRQSLVRTMERGPMKPFFRDLTVEREFESGTSVESYRIGPAGVTIPAARQNPNPGAVTVDPIVHWDGNALVIETAAAGGAPATGRREVWAHNVAGELTLTLTRRSSTEPATPEAYIYRRR